MVGEWDSEPAPGSAPDSVPDPDLAMVSAAVSVLAPGPDLDPAQV